jgi:hypothetical protein
MHVGRRPLMKQPWQVLGGRHCGETVDPSNPFPQGQRKSIVNRCHLEDLKNLRVETVHT